MKDYFDGRDERADMKKEERKQQQVDLAMPDEVIWTGSWQKADGVDRQARPAVGKSGRGYHSGTQIGDASAAVVSSEWGKTYRSPRRAMYAANNLAQDYLKVAKKTDELRRAAEECGARQEAPTTGSRRRSR